jgi:hypothetical protein
VPGHSKILASKPKIYEADVAERRRGRKKAEEIVV